MSDEDYYQAEREKYLRDLKRAGKAYEKSLQKAGEDYERSLEQN